jgi:coproporphyrinogen III oxidase-like Fe-S oxidoreductase
METARSPVAGREDLSSDAREFEALTLALRTPRGVPWDCLEDADGLEGLGLVTRKGKRGERAVLTVRGRLLANEVSTRIRSGILHR